MWYFCMLYTYCFSKVIEVRYGTILSITFNPFSNCLITLLTLFSKQQKIVEIRSLLHTLTLWSNRKSSRKTYIISTYLIFFAFFNITKYRTHAIITPHSQIGHYFFSFLLTCEVHLIEVSEMMAQMQQYIIFLSLKPIKVISKTTLKPWFLLYGSAPRGPRGVKRCARVH